jgi:peptidoglycan hydrolase-like protein with peptidoglycan-binding domain
MMKIWKGAARPLAPQQLGAIAREIDVPVEVLRALISVESSGQFFLRDGSLARRFEPHHLPADVARAIGWSGGWRDALAIAAGRRAQLFDAAYARDPEGTLRASSWGSWQCMGFHFAKLGHGSAAEMVADFADSAQAQAGGLARFVDAAGLAPAMRARDGLTIARIFNGSGQPEAWAAKFEAALRRETGHASPEVLRLGSRGASVRAWQTRLGVPVDGVFGLQTDQATRAEQGLAGLPIDGVVGARTWGAEQSVAPDAAPLPQPRAETSQLARLAAGTTQGAAAVSVGATALAQAEGAVGSILDRLSPWAVDAAILGAAGVAAVAGLVWLIQRSRRVPV